ncbi:FxsA family protein [Couchioplanes azureus]|uniref:FxsA family protein n=1 Tax=Couchioplanes caeruleus TaxID=56438 RepID=UPI001670F14F|nr:FxsA family protein [Couchioplanes caeruleus]
MRRILALLPLGLLLLAAAEIAVFAAVAHALGAGWAVLLVAASSIAGMALLRREGIRGWRAFRSAAEQRRPPGPQVSNSLVGLLGALLLAMPGFVSAVAGLLLILPPGRILARRGVERFTERRVPSAVAGDLFGPRRVRVHQSDPVDEPAPASSTGAAPLTASESATGAAKASGGGRPGPVVTGEVVEGEIIR